MISILQIIIQQAQQKMISIFRILILQAQQYKRSVLWIVIQQAQQYIISILRIPILTAQQHIISILRIPILNYSYVYCFCMLSGVCITRFSVANCCSLHFQRSLIWWRFFSAQRHNQTCKYENCRIFFIRLARFLPSL